MVDPVDQTVEAFGCTMTKDMVKLLQEEGKKQVIGQAELPPMAVAKIIWSGRMYERDVIHYVDNEGARYSTIKGSTPSRESAWLVQAFWGAEVNNRSKSWVSRVPTECNIGDGPSRNEWVELKRIYPQYTRREWTAEDELRLLRRWRRVK